MTQYGHTAAHSLSLHDWTDPGQHKNTLCVLKANQSWCRDPNGLA